MIPLRRFFILPVLGASAFAAAAIAQPDWVHDIVRESARFTVDPSSSVVVLLDARDAVINREGHVRTVVRYAKRILGAPEEKSGIFYEPLGPETTLEDLKGWRISPDGRVTDLEKSDVTEIGVSQVEGYYSDRKILFGSFHPVATGDIIAYEYAVRDEAWEATSFDFLFQMQEPVFRSRLSVHVPGGWTIHQSGWNTGPVFAHRVNDDYSWTADTLPFRPEEPLMPPWEYLAREVAVTAFNPADTSAPQFADWPSVARWMRKLCDPAVDTTGPLGAQVATLTAGAGTPTERARRLCDYVRDRIRYVAVEIGKGGWVPHSSAGVLRNAFGDCKDKATLLRAMLRIAGIPSFPVLANTERDVHADLPSPFQFNHLILAIPRSALDTAAEIAEACTGRWMFVDPTAESNPFGAIPFTLQGSRVLVGDDGDSIMVRLPYSDPSADRITYRAVVHLDALHATADVRIVERGLFRARARHALRTLSAAQQLDEVRRKLTPVPGGADILDYRTGESGDSLWSSFRLSLTGAVTRSAGVIRLRPNLFVPREFPAMTRSSRVQLIWLGHAREIETAIDIDAPPSWKVEEPLPAGEASCGEAARFAFRVVREAGGLHSDSNLKVKGLLVQPSGYPDLKKYSKALRSFENITLTYRTE